MLDRFDAYKPSVVSFLIIIIGLLFSRALLSMGTVALFVCSIFLYSRFSLFQKAQIKQPFFWIPIVFFLLNFIALFGNYNASDLSKDLEISILWIVITIGLGVFGLKINANDYVKTRAFLYVVVCFVGLLSVINYWINQEEINRLLLQSKHIPVIGGMHHIYFGIFNALLVITKIAEWVTSTNRSKSIWLRIEDTSAFLIFIWLHILTSRTGLYAFYIVIPVIIITSLFFDLKRFKKLVWIIVPIVIMPIISYNVFPSFQNKIANTTEDLKATQKGGEEVNFKSMGMRLEAWKNAVLLIKQKPILGHGAGNVESAMQRAYNQSDSTLLQENRIGPHNQFFEFAIKFGILGALLLLFLIFWLIFHAFRTKNLKLIGLVGFISIILCLESVLERQQGVILFALIYYLAFPNNLSSAIIYGSEPKQNSLISG
jgi:O-antigen ligase